MPFDFLATRAAAISRDYRRRSDGSLDTDHYRRLARQEQAVAVVQALRGVTRVLTVVLESWQTRRERLRMRRQVLGMDDRMLRDIGLSRVDAIQGVARTVYRP
jgi:uncharacterized protein YjiS (DUF1127 family)